MQAKVINDAAPTPADNAFAMRVVNHQHDVVPAGHLIDFIQRRQVAIHAENTIRDHQRAAIFSFVFVYNPLQVGHICVGIFRDRRA